MIGGVGLNDTFLFLGDLQRQACAPSRLSSINSDHKKDTGMKPTSRNLF